MGEERQKDESTRKELEKRERKWRGKEQEMLRRGEETENTREQRKGRRMKSRKL